MIDEQQNPQLESPQPVIEGSSGSAPAATPNNSGSTSGANSWMEKINQFSAVASSPNQKAFMILGFLAFMISIGYYLIFGQTLSTKEIKQKEAQSLAQKKEAVVKSAMPVTAPVLSSSAPTQPVDLGLSVSQQLQEPAPPAPPVAPLPPLPAAVFSQPVISTAPTPAAPLAPTPPQPTPLSGGSSDSLINSKALKTSAEKEAEEVAAKLKKRNSGIMVFGGGSGSGAEGDDETKKTGDKKSNTAAAASGAGYLGFGNGGFDNVAIAKTSATQVSATNVGNTDNLILQGKMMNAVLETAINTDLPGSLRALITRDVYAESGNRILIPKGSRVIGTYTNTVGAGQVRVQVTWSRLVRPDGIDIAVSSVGTDNLGRSGVVGVVDNKLWTQIGSALLVSYIIPNVMNKISGVADQTMSQSTSTTNGVAATTTTGNSATISSSTATSQFADVAQNAINSAFPNQPTITVDQGTLINILAQADLVFPSETALAQQKVVK